MGQGDEWPNNKAAGDAREGERALVYAKIIRFFFIKNRVFLFCSLKKRYFVRQIGSHHSFCYLWNKFLAGNVTKNAGARTAVVCQPPRVDGSGPRFDHATCWAHFF